MKTTDRRFLSDLAKQLTEPARIQSMGLVKRNVTIGGRTVAPIMLTKAESEKLQRLAQQAQVSVSTLLERYHKNTKKVA